MDAATAQANAQQQMQEQAAMAQMQAQGMPDPFQPQNVGPEGNLQSAVATSAQGIPVERAGVG